MKLTELNPQWLGAGSEGISDAAGNPVPYRRGVGLTFDCPCASCTEKRKQDPESAFYHSVVVMFQNPLDGQPFGGEHAYWKREGDTFETLTLTPSILKNPERGGCGWHGWVKNGEVLTA